MPTYEYVCRSCGTHVEVFQHFSDPPLTVCGVCGGALRKVYHPAGILFKGSGFYATDSRRRSGGSDHGSSKGESASSKPSAGKDTGAGKEPAKDTSTAPATPPAKDSSSGTKEKSA